MCGRNFILTGCLAGAFTVLMSAGVLYLWWTAAPDVPIPSAPPPPPDNAYHAYRQLVEKTIELQSRVSNLAQLEQQATAPGASADVIRRYVAIYEPIRREIRRLVSQPCMYADEPMDFMMRQQSVFRTWARVESEDIQCAFMEGDHYRAIENLRTVLLLTEQVSRGAPLVRFLTGQAMISSAVTPIAERVASLDARECDRVVSVVREWEQVRAPFREVLENEKRVTIAMYHAMWQGGERLQQLFGTGAQVAARPEQLATRLANLRRATRETVELYDHAIAEAQKPVTQWQPVRPAKHPLNQQLPEVLNNARQISAASIARLRMLGCVAAVRAYYLRTGRYPLILAEAGVDDLNNDPFTGHGFIYRQTERGFVLYSVGPDGKDDGGKSVPVKDLLRVPGDLTLRSPSTTPAPAEPGAER